MDEEQPTVEDILDMIGDQRARDVLAEVSQDSRSAHELADDLGFAPSTVYRRLDELEEHDLVTSETRIAEDGNHYQVFTCNFESTIVSLDDDEYDVRIFRKENLPSRFNDLWDELGNE